MHQHSNSSTIRNTHKNLLLRMVECYVIADANDVISDMMRVSHQSTTQKQINHSSMRKMNVSLNKQYWEPLVNAPKHTML